MLFCPYEPFWGSKNKKILKCNFSLAYFMRPMTLFRHIWMTNGCQIQNQRTKLPLGTQQSEKWLMTSSKVIDLWWPRLTSEWSQCQCKPWVSPRNTYPCPYHQQNIEVRKFQALKRYGTYISLDMPLEIRSQVKSQGRYGLDIFRKVIK